MHCLGNDIRDTEHVDQAVSCDQYDTRRPRVEMSGCLYHPIITNHNLRLTNMNDMLPPPGIPLQKQAAGSQPGGARKRRSP
jgi:hypothetical protein